MTSTSILRGLAEGPKAHSKTSILHFSALLAATLFSCMLVCWPDLSRADENDVRVELVPQTSHSGNIRAIEFSADDRFIMTVAERSLRLWDVKTHTLIRTFDSFTADITATSLSPDARSLATFDENDGLRIWNTVSGKVSKILAGNRPAVTALVFSRSGASVIAGGRDGIISLWNLEDGRITKRFGGHNAPISNLGISDNGETLLSASSDRTIRTWDVETARFKLVIRQATDFASVAFSKDGLFALSGDAVGTVSVWDLSIGEEIRQFSGSGAVANLAVSADGRNFLRGVAENDIQYRGRSQGFPIFYNDVATGKLTRTFKRGDANNSPVALDNSGRFLANMEGSAPALWDLKTGEISAYFSVGDASGLGVHFLSRNQAVVHGSKDLRFWDISTGSQTTQTVDADLPSPFELFVNGERFAFSPDGEFYLIDDPSKSPQLFDTASGQPLIALEGTSGEPDRMVFSDDGRRVWGTSIYNRVPAKLWDVNTGKLIGLFPPDDFGLFFPALSADGRFAAAKQDRQLAVFNLAIRKFVRSLAFPGDLSGVRVVAISADGGKLAALSGKPGQSEDTVYIWSVESGKLIQTYSGLGTIYRLAFSPDGNILAASGTQGAHLVSSSIDSNIRRFTSKFVFKTGFSPDGTRLISLSDDGNMIWDVVKGDLLVTEITTHSEHLVITPEGFFDGSRDAAKALTVVRGLEVYSIDQVYDQLYRPDLVREKLAGDPTGLVREAAARIDLDKAIGSGAPPRVTFVEPPTTVAGDRTDMTVALTDQGGGIGKVEWRVNGVTVGLGTRGVGRTDKPAATSGGQHLSQDIPLSPGDNVVEVVAYNAAGLVASVPVSATIKSSAPLRPAASTLYVLAVGVNDYYDSRLALNFAVSDAQAVSEGFSKAKGSYYGRVDTRLLLDKDVTSAGLEKAFAEIGAKAKPQDTFVLFMAGHGKTVDGRYYYLPRDFRYRDPSSFAADGIGQDRLQQWIAQVGAQRSVLLFDTCESGSLTGDEFAMRGVERAVAMEKMTAAIGRTTIAAASDTRPALEGYQGHGVFTYAFLEGLNDADGDGNGGVDVLEMMAYLDRQVPELSDRAFKQRQIPQAKFSGSNFVLAAKTTVLESNSGQAGKAKIDLSTAPGFVVISRTEVMTAPANGTRLQVLEPGAQVRVVRTEAGWMVVVRDGRELGFVRAEALARLQ